MKNMFGIQAVGYLLTAHITMITCKGVSAVLTNMFSMGHKKTKKNYPGNNVCSFAKIENTYTVSFSFLKKMHATS